MWVYQLLEVVESEEKIRIMHYDSSGETFEFFAGLAKDCKSKLTLSGEVKNITSNPNSELVITV